MERLVHQLYSRIPVSIQNLLISTYGYHLKRRRYGGKFSTWLQQLRQAPWESREKLEELESFQLQAMIRHCYENVPYYRKLFDDYGIKPESIQDRGDLRNIPHLEKEEVRKNPEQFLSRLVDRRKLHVAYTSGSTGTPIKFYQSTDLIRWQYACHKLVREWVGLPAGSKRATFGGRLVVPKSQSSPPFWRSNVSERQMLFSSYHLNEHTLKFYAEKLREFQPDEVIGYPSSVYLIARYLVGSGIADVRPKAVLTNSESLLGWQREMIEKGFGCRVIDWYSSEEFVFFHSQCQEAGVYHEFPFVGILQFLPYAGDEAESAADVAGTSLLNMDMPLIRYKLGDVVNPGKDDAVCGCGRRTHLMRSPTGRSEDFVLASDGSLVGRLDHVFKGLSHIVESQIVQEEPHRVKVMVQRDNGYDESTNDIIRSRLRDRLGREMIVEINHVDRIPRSGRQKFRAVISKLDLPVSTLPS